MVLSFEKFHSKRQARAEYRRRLVEKIVDCHREAGDQELKNQLYLDHLKDGFPLHILEDIATRLSESPKTHCS